MFLKFIEHLKRCTKGQGLVEYGLILALISIVTMGTVGGVGEKVKDTFNIIEPELGPEQSTLKMNFNGGINNGGTNIIKDVGGFSTILAPTRQGYSFAGWEESGSGRLMNLGEFMPKRTDTDLKNQDYWMDNISVYNNLHNGTVTHEKVSNRDINLWNPDLKNSFIRIKSDVGSQNPDRGGFYQYTYSNPNQTYYQVIVANIPKGFKINRYSNSVGDSPEWTWLTDREGTGKPETYIYKLETSATGYFFTFGHIAIVGDSGVPLSWDLYYSHVMNATGSNVDKSKIFVFDHSGNKFIKAKWDVN